MQRKPGKSRVSKKQIVRGCELKMNYCMVFRLAFGAQYRKIGTKLVARFLFRCMKHRKDRDYALTCFVISSCKLLAFSSNSTCQTKHFVKRCDNFSFQFEFIGIMHSTLQHQNEIQTIPDTDILEFKVKMGSLIEKNIWQAFFQNIVKYGPFWPILAKYIFLLNLN